MPGGPVFNESRAADRIARVMRGCLGGPALKGCRQTRPHNCVQAALATLLDLPIEFVEREAGTTATMTLPDVHAVLGRMGIQASPVSASFAAEWWSMLYRQRGGRRLRAIGCQVPKRPEDVGHAYVLAGRHLYDPATDRWHKTALSSLQALDFLVFLPPASERSPSVAAIRDASRAGGPEGMRMPGARPVRDVGAAVDVFAGT